MKKIKSLLVIIGVVTFAACSPNEKQFCPGSSKETRTLLAMHETKAILIEIKDHKCMGRTSACPEKCGHSGKVATFQIKEYINYEKKDKWGSQKQNIFHIQLTGCRKTSSFKQNSSIIAKVNSLDIGDEVLLSWNHNRVKSNTKSHGEREVIKLQKL